MPFLESLQDGLDRILPRRKNAAVSKSISGGIGHTAGIVRYQDDVRLLPAVSFRSVLFFRCRVAVWLVVTMHLNLDVLSNFGYVIPPSLLLLQMLVWTSLARWSFSSSSPCYGSYGLRSFLLHIIPFPALLTRFADNFR